VCRERGGPDGQAVLIPASNVQHLMLREEVIEAVAAKRFAVYAVSTVDEALELLTGLPAGVRDDKGEFSEGSVNRRVEDRLIEFSQARQAFGKEEKVIEKAAPVPTPEPGVERPPREGGCG
jgi:predicted ATP-dependent protease